MCEERGVGRSSRMLIPNQKTNDKAKLQVQTLLANLRFLGDHHDPGPATRNNHCPCSPEHVFRVPFVNI